MLRTLTIACLVAGSAHGATLRVPADHRSVTAAVLAASPGDVIEVAPGTYSAATTGERFPLVLQGKDLVLRGAGAGRSVLHGEGAARLIHAVRDASRISGFTVAGGFTQDDGAAVLALDSSLELERIHFTGHEAEAGGDVLAVHGGEPRLANCLIEGNGRHGPTILVTAGAPVFEQTTFHGNGGPTFEIGADASPLIRTTIISAPGHRGGEAVGIRIVCGDGLGVPLLESNLFDACFDGTVSIVGEAEEILDGVLEDARRLDGLREGNPLFGDPAGGDFRLGTNSPARSFVDPDAQLGAFGGADPLTREDGVADGDGTVAKEREFLGPSVPNPFTPATTIHFTVLETAAVDVGIYNVLGQRIRTLHTGDLSGGNHTRTWDGRDDAGGESPPGIYFVRVTQGDVTESRRLVLVR